MPTVDSPDHRVRVDTLVRLRWLAIFGQFAAIVVVAFGLSFPLPLTQCLLIIGMATGLNLWLWWSHPRATLVSDRRAAFVLGFDLVQLSGLLYLTGGLANPFAVLLLAPVLISATILRLSTTVSLGVLVSLLISALAMWHHPLPWADQQPPLFPPFYLLGVWAALLVAIGFICTYAWRVAYESRNLSNALAAAELALEREQHLSDLDGMAAAAAHELGTPLGTIAVVVKEMSRAVEPASPLAEDIALIQTQAERCRAILSKLTSLGTDHADVIATKSLEAALNDITAPHSMFDIEITVGAHGEGAQPRIRSNPALTYGVGNLIENAVDFARRRVKITGGWDETTISICVEDDGPGFAPDVLARIGEPYVSRRRPGTLGTEAESPSGGLGLGFFIAKTLLERASAQISVKNHAPDLGGAAVLVTFPRGALEAAAKTEQPRQ
ncbi:MAG: ActS/PrrB/RegB family redox-sensitive histidine kinase [Pseudomonadota bacterium]